MEAIGPLVFFFALIYGGFILGVLTDRLILRRKPATNSRQPTNPESGSVFTMLLAGMFYTFGRAITLWTPERNGGFTSGQSVNGSSGGAPGGGPICAVRRDPLLSCVNETDI